MELEKYRPYWTKDYLMGPNSLRVLQELLEKNPSNTLSSNTDGIFPTPYSFLRLDLTQCGTKVVCLIYLFPRNHTSSNWNLSFFYY